jgi:ribonuclease BN (tRNA processing enzyme)
MKHLRLFLLLLLLAYCAPRRIDCIPDVGAKRIIVVVLTHFHSCHHLDLVSWNFNHASACGIGGVWNPERLSWFPVFRHHHVLTIFGSSMGGRRHRVLRMEVVRRRRIASGVVGVRVVVVGWRLSWVVGRRVLARISVVWV